MLTIRCSSLPVIDLCPPAAQHPDVLIDMGGPPAALGSAVHEYWTNRIANPRLLGASSAVADRWGVDHDELGSLASLTWKAWQKVERFFGNPVVEQEVAAQLPGDVLLKGRCDVRSKLSTEIRIVDLKSGWLDADATPQLKGYALASLAEYTAAEADSVYAAVLRPRLGTYEAWRWGRAELERWGRDLSLRVTAAVERFSPGEHCGRCKRFYGCPGATRWVRESVSFLENASFDSDLLPDDMVNLIERARAVEKVCEQARLAVRVHVAQAGGRLVGTSKALELRRTDRRQIEFAAARPVLEAAVGADQVPELVSVSVTALEAAVKNTAGRGQKTAAVKDLWDRLDRAGAVTKVPTERLEVVRNEQPSIGEAEPEPAQGNG